MIYNYYLTLYVINLILFKYVKLSTKFNEFNMNLFNYMDVHYTLYNVYCTYFYTINHTKSAVFYLY